MVSGLECVYYRLSGIDDRPTRRNTMAFNAAFFAHAPDADPARHTAEIDTGKYKLYVVVVKNQAEALEAAKRLVDEENVRSILLCPGFSNKDVAELDELVGPTVGIGVSRTDAPGNRIALEVMKEAGWF
jgi:hypothetical protein